MKQAAIVGIGQTEYSWDSGRPETVLAIGAIKAALEDAGLTLQDVDGVVRSSIESTTPIELVSLTGMRPLSFAADDATWGGFVGSVIGLAREAIATGRARVVVVFRAFNGRSQLRLGRPMPGSVEGQGAIPRARGNLPVGGEFTAPYGVVSPSQVFALWVRAYMERHGIDAERMGRALGAVVCQARQAAQRNPAALLHGKSFGLADYLASPMLAEPLRKADICLESDGACAVVMAAADLARDCRQVPVHVADAWQHVIPGYQNMWLMDKQLPPSIGREVVPAKLARHGLTPQDLDVLGLYDATSFAAIWDIETLGLCPPGGGVDWVLDPEIPFNTSGGLLAEVYLQGLNQAVELVRQLRGTSTSQVPGAQHAFLGAAALMSGALLARGLP
jgi:acetyl-CoA acetyltransferase